MTWEHLKPGSSPVDWCEGNYQVSANIAEFVNTVSAQQCTKINTTCVRASVHVWRLFRHLRYQFQTLHIRWASCKVINLN